MVPTTEAPLQREGEPPASFPCVVKVSDTQFYVGTRICYSEEEWRQAWTDMNGRLLRTGVEARRAFYFKWARRFGVTYAAAWGSAADVVLAHTEPYIASSDEF